MSDKVRLIKQLLLDNADYYGQEINRVQLLMWPQDLIDLDVQAIERALSVLRRDPKRKFMPLPSEIRERAGAGGSDEADAEEVANRIWSAIARHGHVWPQIAKDQWPQVAQDELGSLGWAVVMQWGGWLQVVTDSNDAEAGTMRAQLRKSAASMIARSRAGTLGRAPSLPSPTAQAQLTKLSDVLPQIAAPTAPGRSQIAGPKEGPSYANRENEDRSHPQDHRGLPRGSDRGPGTGRR